MMTPESVDVQHRFCEDRNPACCRDVFVLVARNQRTPEHLLFPVKGFLVYAHLLKKKLPPTPEDACDYMV